MKPFWVTFYSYKGGVGRSMALANVAALFVKNGRRVVMIDFDLEAPGLDSFQELGVQPNHKGVVEYVFSSLESSSIPPLEEYVQECKFPRHLPGKAWLISSGRKDDTYNFKRTSVDWERLYATGFAERFIENWKAAIERLYKPDYVFVDSRTGLTDVAGICTLHLPDLVVLMFALNSQNITGIEAVLQTIRSAPHVRPPQVLPVASPVPNWPRNEDTLLDARFTDCEKRLGLNIECAIHYNPAAALIERLFSIETGDPSRISVEYVSLMRAIQKRDEKGFDSLIRRASDLIQAGKEEGGAEIVEALLEDYSDRAEALFVAGHLQRFLVGRDQAVATWLAALKVDPTFASAFEALISYYINKRNFGMINQLYQNRIAASVDDDPVEIGRLLREQGEHLMAHGQYAEAVKVYEASRSKTTDGDDGMKLVTLFNLAEAMRRLEGFGNAKLYTEAIALWEQQSLEDQPLTIQANKLQAMHVAYACVGKTEAAATFLVKARECAKSVGKTERIFSLKTYTNVTPDEFLSANDEMELSLKKGRLWDGMPL